MQDNCECTEPSHTTVWPTPIFFKEHPAFSKSSNHHKRAQRSETPIPCVIWKDQQVPSCTNHSLCNDTCLQLPRCSLKTEMKEKHKNGYKNGRLSHTAATHIQPSSSSHHGLTGASVTLHYSQEFLLIEHLGTQQEQRGGESEEVGWGTSKQDCLWSLSCDGRLVLSATFPAESFQQAQTCDRDV